MEVRPEQTLDQLLRGGWYRTATLQRHTDTEERLVHRPMGAEEVLRTLQGRQEGTHANDKGERTVSQRRPNEKLFVLTEEGEAGERERFQISGAQYVV